MSEPLKRLIELNDPNVFYSIHDIERILDAAIDRINELEKRYSGHWHGYEDVVNGAEEPTTDPIEADEEPAK